LLDGAGDVEDMNRLVGTLLVLIAFAVALPTVAALAQAALPVLVGLLILVLALWPLGGRVS
jgi:hypothetical protein